MSQFALSATATLPYLCRNVKQLNKVFPIFTGRYAIKSSMYGNFQRKGFSVIASSNAGMNGGVAELSESEQDLKRYMWPDKKRPKVCIVGGGFGGLYTALRLESLIWPDGKKPQVLLIDQSERFVFKPMLYELLSGEVDEWEVAPRFSDLLAYTDVQFIQDRVKLLHPSYVPASGGQSSSCAGTVQLESDLLIEYDWLVLALGAEPKLDNVPGAVEYALPFNTFADACKVNNKLKALERKNFGKELPIRVVVVGCGYSGVELAATVAERLKDKGIVQAINVENTICPSAPSGNREAALKVLSDRNVQLMLGYFVKSVNRAAVVEELDQLIDDGNIGVQHDAEELIVEVQPAERGRQSQILKADLVLWTVGNKPSLPQLEPCDKPHILPLNNRGQAETDETLRVKGNPRIFALGDSSALRDPNGRLLPSTAQVAFQQADFAGWNIWAAINDRPLLPFRRILLIPAKESSASFVLSSVLQCPVMMSALRRKKFNPVFQTQLDNKFQNLGEMMTLGRYDAAVTPSFIDGLTLEGPIGHAARKLAYLIRLPTDQHRIKVGLSWFTKEAVDSVAMIQTTLTKVLSGS